MRVTEFTNQYADLARLVRADPDELRAHDRRHAERRPRWLAYADGEPVGVLDAWIRPDDRCFVDVQGDPQASRRLLAAAAGLRREFFAEADESDVDRLRTLGFTEVRREGRYALPVDPATTGLPVDSVPSGYAFVSAAEVEPAALLALDNDLRQDVPGSQGWRGGLQWFTEETYDSPAFDPATYLVATAAGGAETGSGAGDAEARPGAMVGLVRLWWNPPDWGERAGPRLGLVAVRREHRRRGLAATLLGTVFAVAHGRGATDVPAEIDDSSAAMRALTDRIGGRRVGTTMELVLRV